MSDPQAAIAHLQRLRSDHRNLDDTIDKLSHRINVEPLELVSLKKQRLRLKDTITRMESELHH